VYILFVVPKSECPNACDIDFKSTPSLYKILANVCLLCRALHKRHTYATRLFEKGVPLKTIQKLLGHSRLEITANIHTHVHIEEAVKAVELLNDVL